MLESDSPWPRAAELFESGVPRRVDAALARLRGDVRRGALKPALPKRVVAVIFGSDRAAELIRLPRAPGVQRRGPHCVRHAAPSITGNALRKRCRSSASTMVRRPSFRAGKRPAWMAL